MSILPLGHELLSAEEEVLLGRAVMEGREAERALSEGARLSPAERRRLMRKVREGREARERFILSNLRLVTSIAARVPLSGVSGFDFEDAVQEGVLGLMTAVEKFDWRKGFRFSTYATFWIRQAISRGLERGGSPIKLPASVAGLVRQDPSLLTCVSIDSTLPGTEVRVEDTISADEDVEEEVLSAWRAEQVRGCVSRLGGDERRVLEAFLLLAGEGGRVKMSEVRRRVGLSEREARRSWGRAVRALTVLSECVGDDSARADEQPGENGEERGGG